MMDLYRKIASLTEGDYENTFDIARIMDYINQRAQEALKRRDLNEIRGLQGLIDGWIASINKWKERYRRLLIKISRVESDLGSLSLRLSKIAGETERLMIKESQKRNSSPDADSIPEKDGKSLEPEVTYEIPTTI